MERFFWSLKHEWTKHEVYRDVTDARLSVFKYIEMFYNSKRIHQSLGYKTPDQYEAEHATASNLDQVADITSTYIIDAAKTIGQKTTRKSDGERLTSNRQSLSNLSPFACPRHVLPSGSAMHWKRLSTT